MGNALSLGESDHWCLFGGLGKEGRPFAIPSSRNLLAPESVQAAEKFFQAGEG